MSRLSQCADALPLSTGVRVGRKEQLVSLREKVRRLVEARRFQHAIIAVIIVNAVTLGAETSAELMSRAGGLLHTLDRIALSIFVAELVLKLYAYRWRFFRDPWNVFDLIVVGIALVPTTGAFSVLRALRVLRVLRLISVVPSMRRVVATLLAALPGVSSIVALLVLVIYVAGVMATKLFGEVTPHYFGSLGRSLWTLFQVMTGEGWPVVADEVMSHSPMAWVFFLIFILISTFVVLNLFLAVMVNAMETVRAQDPARKQEPEAASGPPASAATAAGTETPDTTGAGTEAPGGTEVSNVAAVDAGPASPNVAEELAALRREVAALRSLLEPGNTGATIPGPRP
jgi:voltage-gated sodium channel